VPPYPERFGGCVLSCTIDKYAFVSLRAHEARKIKVRSEDFDLSAEYNSGEDECLAGKLDIAQAIFRRFGAAAIDIYMHSDAPPGSGLGSSSAMIVALIEAIAKHQSLHLTPQETAEVAVSVEREDLRIAGGLQDQFASAFGGFNFIEFSSHGVLVTPLRLPADLLAELHYHLILCYTGTTRLSSNILAEQTSHVLSEDAKILRALSQMKDLTYGLKRALLQSDIGEFGALLDEAWRIKKTLASGITNEPVEQLYEAAKRAGAIGGKLLGAGGGGYLLLCVPFGRGRSVREALENLGGTVVNFQFEHDGARTWKARPDTWL
jgi:D-glycero-alpha-D-manno-heptose-7-phosphate kinase